MSTTFFNGYSLLKWNASENRSHGDPGTVWASTAVVQGRGNVVEIKQWVAFRPTQASMYKPAFHTLLGFKTIYCAQQLVMPMLGRQLIIAVDEDRGYEGLWCAPGRRPDV